MAGSFVAARTAKASVAIERALPIASFAGRFRASVSLLYTVHTRRRLSSGVMAKAIRGWWKRNDIALALLAGLFAAPLLTHALARYLA